MLFGRECYPYKTLESLEFKRAKCKFCGKYFWSKKSRDFCDDDECRVKAGFAVFGILILFKISITFFLLEILN